MMRGMNAQSTNDEQCRRVFTAGAAADTLAHLSFACSRSCHFNITVFSFVKVYVMDYSTGSSRKNDESKTVCASTQVDQNHLEASKEA